MWWIVRCWWHTVTAVDADTTTVTAVTLSYLKLMRVARVALRDQSWFYPLLIRLFSCFQHRVFSFFNADFWPFSLSNDNLMLSGCSLLWHEEHIVCACLLVFQDSWRASLVWWNVRHLVTWATVNMWTVTMLPVKVRLAAIRQCWLPCIWQHWLWQLLQAQCRGVPVHTLVLLLPCAVAVSICTSECTGVLPDLSLLKTVCLFIVLTVL